jgi:23S rRNA (guanosine2251-2'-O)-methyltransferase
MGQSAEYDWVYGLHAVQALLEHSPQQVVEMWLDRQRHDKRVKTIQALAEQHGVAVQAVDSQTLEQHLGGVSHQGLAARVRARAPLGEDQLGALLDAESAPLLLVLDGVQDPHNLGACLRSADAAGVAAVIVPRDRACGLTSTVRKVASGAAQSVPFVQVTNLARTLRQLKQRGIWIYGLAAEADGELYALDLGGPTALVLGAEGRGLRRLTAETCDALVRLPMLGQVASLNVSVSAGICLYEALRQRRGALQ